jgi:hypothetical protein
LKRFDPEAIKARLLARMQVDLNWALLSENGTISAILDTFADGLAEVSRYGEYLLAEKKWTTAQNISSLNSQASMVGYKSKRNRSAISYVIVSHTDENGVNRLANYGRTFFSLDDRSNYDNISQDSGTQDVYRAQALVPWTYDTPYSVPVATRFIAANGTEFIATSTIASRPLKEPWDIVINDTARYNTFLSSGGWNGIKYLKVPVIQGKIRSYTLGTSQGARFESLLLPVANCEEADNNVSNSFLKVYVNSTPINAANRQEWVQVQNILLAGPADRVFEVVNLPDYSGVIFKFGDGITGARLPAKAEVSCDYLESLGATGNIDKKYQITSIVFPAGTAMIDPRTQSPSQFLSATNDTTILGGQAAEVEADLRINAPIDYLRYYSIATTKAYETQILKYAPIGLDKAKVFAGNEVNATNTAFVLGSNNTAITVPTARPVLYVTAIAADGTAIENAQDTFVTPVSQALGDLKAPSDTLTYIAPDFIRLKLNATIHSADTNLADSDIIALERQALIDKYSVFNMDFNKPFYNSEFVYTTKSFPFVDYVDTFIEAVATPPLSTATVLPLPSRTAVIGSASVTYPILYSFNFQFDQIYGENAYYQGFRNHRQSSPYLLRIDLTFINNPTLASTSNRTFFLFDNRYLYTAAGTLPEINAGKLLDQTGAAIPTNRAAYTTWLRPEETLENFDARAVRVAQFPYITAITDDQTMVSTIKTFNKGTNEIRPYVVDGNGNNRMYNVSEVTWPSGAADPRVILPGGTQCYLKDSRYIDYADIQFTENYSNPSSSDYATGSLILPADYFGFTTIDVTSPTEFIGALTNYVSIKVYAQPLLNDISPRDWNQIVCVDTSDILIQRVLTKQ